MEEQGRFQKDHISHKFIISRICEIFLNFVINQWLGDCMIIVSIIIIIFNKLMTLTEIRRDFLNTSSLDVFVSFCGTYSSQILSFFNEIVFLTLQEKKIIDQINFPKWSSEWMKYICKRLIYTYMILESWILLLPHFWDSSAFQGCCYTWLELQAQENKMIVENVVQSALIPSVHFSFEVLVKIAYDGLPRPETNKSSIQIFAYMLYPT